MKYLLRISLLALVAMAFTQCEKVVRETTYTANVPVYMSYEDMRASVKNDNDQVLERPGKIFLYNEYILINDFEKGIHIYNNIDPRNPQHEAFISIPGNVDIAVKDGILYADNFVDLVAINITDPKNAEVVGRAKNVLSYTIPSSINYGYPVSSIDQSKGVVVGYTIGEVTETCTDGDCGEYYYNNWENQPGMMSETGAPTTFSGNATNARSATVSQNGSGLAGSMARFLLVEDYLYVISSANEMKVFSLDGTAPSEVRTVNPLVDGGGMGMIETLYAFKEHLFIGSTTGMFAYNIENPASPDFVSMHQHFTACDPVVANDDYAFITLRGGRQCGAGAGFNMMKVVDIRDIMNPKDAGDYGMSDPKGLAIDDENQLLFLCDGYDGLKIFSTSNPQSMQQISRIDGMDTYDVIAARNIVNVISTGGLKQYEYTSDGIASLLSTIDLGR